MGADEEWGSVVAGGALVEVVVVVGGGVISSGLPDCPSGGVVMASKGPPRNWVMVTAAASGWTTSTSPAW